MLSYCLRCRKNTETENPKVVKIKNRRIMLLSRCSVCSSTKLKFLKNQESRGALSNLLGVKLPILSHFLIVNIMQQ